MKRVLCAVLTALLWSQGMPAAHAAEPVKPASSGVEVSAKSVILMERETGTVLYQQAEHEQREPASVTKIMTMLLVVALYLGSEIADGLTRTDNVSHLTHIVGGVCGIVFGFRLARAKKR